MSYSKCFVCGADNYSGNETRIVVESKTLEKERPMQRTETVVVYICDECMRKPIDLSKLVGR